MSADPAALTKSKATGRASALLGLLAFVTYVLTLAPAPYLLDSAELAAASFALGIAHPPGEPLSLLLGKLFTFLPLGSVAFRVGLAQALAGATAVVVVHRLALALIGNAGDAARVAPSARAWLAGSSALAFALCPGVVMSSIRPEVYALATALALGALAAGLCAQQRRDPRAALLGALLIGLGLCNHPLIAGLTGVAAAALALPLLWSSSPPVGRARLVGGALAALLVGLLVLGYLPVRGSALATPGHADVIAWGEARTGAGLAAILSARTFTAKAGIVHTSASPEAFPFVLLDELGLAIGLLALAGVFFGARTRGARGLTTALLLAGAGSGAAALWAGFDPHNPDIRGYLGVALAATAILAAGGATPLLAGLAQISRRFETVPLTTIAAAALMLLVLVHALPLPSAVRLSHRVAADQAVAELLTPLPPRATVATVHFETGFLLAYQRVVEGRRPDLAWVHLGFVRGPGYAARLRLDHPQLAPLLDAHAQGPLTLAAARATGQALALEPDDELAPDLRRALVPLGGLWLLPMPAPDPTAAATAEPRAPERPAPLLSSWLAEAAADRQVRGFLGHRALRDAAIACRRGLASTARLRVAELQALVPNDQRARALMLACPVAAP